MEPQATARPEPAAPARPRSDRRRPGEHAAKPRAAQVLGARAQPLPRLPSPPANTRGSKASFLILQEETARALTEALEKLNRRSGLRQYVARVIGAPKPSRAERRRTTGRSSLSADPDGDMADGDILVDSVLVLPAGPELGAGERTRRITTRALGIARHHEGNDCDEPATDAARGRSRASSTRTTRVTTPTISRKILSPSAAAASAIPSTSASSRLSTSRASTPVFAATRRPAVASSSI